MSVEHYNIQASRRAAIHAQRAFVELLCREPATASGSLEDAAQFITQSCAHLLGSERAGVWLFDDAKVELTCHDLFSLSSGGHLSGAILKEEEYRPEFRELKTALYVDASFPLTDPRTVGYVDGGYLKPNGITSMLDAAIRLGGANVGTLCIEHVDERHVWTQDEIDFACLVGCQLSVLLERQAWQRAERCRAEWASVVAHDLRQPVCADLLRAQMLERTQDATVRKHADRIRAEASHLTRMIDDLMDVCTGAKPSDSRSCASAWACRRSQARRRRSRLPQRRLDPGPSMCAWSATCPRPGRIRTVSRRSSRTCSRTP